MTYIEGNKIIGVFDGWYEKELPNNGDLTWFHETYSTKLTNSLWMPSKPANFKYHTSWDWLMPVVEKIEAFDEPTFVVINGHHCEISQMVNHNWPKDRDTISDVGHPEGSSKIDSTWKAVVQFIKWYNSPNH